MKITAHRIPGWVVQQAMKMLCRYQHNRVLPSRIITTGHLSLRINPRWRLLSRDEGKNWEVMSHETYNRRKDQR